MEINTATTAYIQVQNTPSNTSKTVQSQASLANGLSDKSLSTSGLFSLSGEELMMSRLFRDANANPPVITQLTETTIAMSSVNLLTNDDREMPSELYDQVQQQRITNLLERLNKQ
ncbi:MULTISPECIES: hypothetical protein [unclassified Brenneria]|uniref:hypothetical protein n=1 Tax=unclassified Brenneria TaxID=2634434 RepID=UPI00155365D3|nr:MULTISPECIES: hypothetical protein [unclassified Brenneria]MBJ7223272.1 hypothetical protein [Brenneria sp. L3-3C-1]MEE3644512.1 hypothetical protein [Brenneria sp. L3_3C_1]MEE3652073.1 hypothetical protein [Brenneria sp. HEZEL_4_2_4]NPD02034.1 hypothetical protein [Brenneria sp. hezel4-2-4]